MTPHEIEQVFGRDRLKMATGEHVEVFREAMVPGERRRYTKRFLATQDGDFGPWTEREWRILARLIGHGIRCVPDVVQFDGGALGGARLVQTYDAGITVDQWGTLLPVARRGEAYRHVFEDCAHWWSLAHHCLSALDEIHALGLVHLDIKGDNICIPYGPADFDPSAPSMRLRPEFGRLALIDFAFSLVSRESLATPLPIGWQKDYDYQSPRLLKALDAGRNGDLEPTRELDWRCDFYSLAAMLKRYLPPAGRADEGGRETGWTAQRYDDARTLIFRLRDSHDRELPHWRPHGQFIDYASARLDAPDLARSLAEGWSLARDTATAGIATPMTAITPMTRIAPMLRTARRGRSRDATAVTAVSAGDWGLSSALVRTQVSRAPVRRASQRALPAWILLATLVAVASPSFIGNPEQPLADRTRELLAELRLPFDRPAEDVAPAVMPPSAAVPAEPAANAEVDRRPSGESAGVTESTAPASSSDGVADASSMPTAPAASRRSVVACSAASALKETEPWRAGEQASRSALRQETTSGRRPRHRRRNRPERRSRRLLRAMTQSRAGRRRRERPPAAAKRRAFRRNSTPTRHGARRRMSPQRRATESRCRRRAWRWQRRRPGPRCLTVSPRCPQPAGLPAKAWHSTLRRRRVRRSHRANPGQRSGRAWRPARVLARARRQR